MRLWATYLKEVAIDAMRTRGMCHPTATKIQDALVASLVVGADIPPIRPRVIKKLCHPNYNALKCQDDDCLLVGCLGDRLELMYEEEDNPSSKVIGVRLYVIHGKNDRRSQDSSFQLDFPDGVFRDLLVAYLLEGRQLLDRSSNNVTSMRLFVSRLGHSFSDATFTHYWKGLMDTSACSFGITYFPPTDSRTVFVEDCTYSMPMETWEGAALVMGNCVRQWKPSYWPSRKKRMVENVVASYSKYIYNSNEHHALALAEHREA